MVDGVFTIPLNDSAAHADDLASASMYAVSAPVFLAGDENRLAAVAVQSVFSEPNCSFNPLVFCGPSGIGKTQLLRALLHHWKHAHDRRRVVYQTGTQFARRYANALETQSLEEVRRSNRCCELFALDDLGQLVDKPSAQSELMRTLDAVIDCGGFVVVTSSHDPANMPKFLPGLKSRLCSGLIVPLAQPGVEARLAILQTLAAGREIALSPQAAQLLAEQLEGTVSTLSGALMDLLYAGGANDDDADNAVIDVARCQQYLSRKVQRQQPTLRAIAVATARYFSLKLANLRGPRRQRAVTTARGVAMYLARRLTDSSLRQVGNYFGKRDHTTVLHNCRKTQRLLQIDGSVRQAVEELSTKLAKPASREKHREKHGR